MFDEIEGLCDKVVSGMQVTTMTAATLAPSQDVAMLTAAAVAVERVRRSADAAQLAILAELARRGFETGPDGSTLETRAPAGEVAELACDTIALALGCSDHDARTRSRLAVRLGDDLDPLIRPLMDGAVTERTLRLVADETQDASRDAAAAVVAHVLAPMRGTDVPRIEALDRHDLAQACRRVLDRTDPGWRESRAEVNRRERTDVRTYPGPLGTTELVACLPSETAHVLMAGVCEIARERQRKDPDLRVGPARALALADLALRGVEVSTHITLGLALVRGPSDPGEAEVAGDVKTAGETRTAGEMRTAGETRTAGDDRTAGETGTASGARAVSAAEGRLIDVGATGKPWVGGVEIPRIGWVPGSVVQQVVERLDSRVTRALLDPETGTVLETSTTGYVPPPSVRRLVELRDTRCRMWGCDRPAVACDLDHATAWPGGPTCGANLSALCRHHHRVKHAPAWSYVLHADGSAEWVSPGGTQRLTWPTAYAPAEAPAQAPAEAASHETTGAPDPSTPTQPTTPDAGAGHEAVGHGAVSTAPPF
ncbi:hypothetical protein EEW87_16725 [Janibacter melonis]|uniref:DUF222 domain-containing protein n=1 Tax=Janibacter melonis TaxID=262209 RepID=A0A650GDU3_9MICO|nr:HNH endonuclease signature motif containing protein [Janibacter melonis]QGX08473.1 hypothetical protein EEW87_16725 [Janibacter melonis]